MMVTNSPFMFQSQASNFPLQHTGYQEPRMPDNMMFPYDQLPMSMGSGNSFAYDPSQFPSTMSFDHSHAHGQTLDHRAAAQFESLQSHSMNMDHTAQYAAMQAQTTYPSTYWEQPQPQSQPQPQPQAQQPSIQPQLQPQPQAQTQTQPQPPPTPEIPRTHPIPSAAMPAATAPLPVESANSRRRPRTLQSSAQASSAMASHRFIQPKRPSPVKGGFTPFQLCTAPG